MMVVFWIGVGIVALLVLYHLIAVFFGGDEPFVPPVHELPPEFKEKDRVE
jgi:hypothetical protein